MANSPFNRTHFATPYSKIIYQSARGTGQLKQNGRFGQADNSFVTQLQTGTILPDTVAGWSVKTILVGALILVLWKR